MIHTKLAVMISNAVKEQFGLEVVVLDNDSEKEHSFNSRLIPVSYHNKVYCHLYFKEEAGDKVVKNVKAFVQAICCYNETQKLYDTRVKREAELISLLVSKNVEMHANEIRALASDLNYEIKRPMAVIVAHLIPYHISDLNMNFENKRLEETVFTGVLSTLQNHPFLNRHDLFAFIEPDCFVLLKVFENMDNPDRLYDVQQKLEEVVSETLNSYKVYDCYVSAGSIAENFDTVYASFEEAMDNIAYALDHGVDHRIITSEDVLFHKVVSHIPDEFQRKEILPRVSNLMHYNFETILYLMQCFDVFVNNQFNFATTAKALYLHRNTVIKRLNKIRQLTGIDPTGPFEDIFKLKLIFQQYMVMRRDTQ